MRPVRRVACRFGMSVGGPLHAHYPRRSVRVCPRCHSVFTVQTEFCGIDGEALVEREDDPLIGTSLGCYRIVERLGTGGMGCVYRATHTSFAVEFAVKVLYGDMAANPAVVRRFRREAETITRLSHPNIVSIVEFGSTPEGLQLMVMRLVDGRSLAAAMAGKEAFAFARVAGIVRQIASGLAAAHELGFVHRDLTPANVMLEADGDEERVKILDFGVVGLLEPDGDEPKLTRTGFTLGTPVYMAPEQVEGAKVGPAADLYSLGVMLYEMLAGRPPFKGALNKLVADKMLKPPPPLPDARGLDQLAYDLLARMPKNRTSSAQEVIEALDRIGLDAPAARVEPPTDPGSGALRVVFDAGASAVEPGRRVGAYQLVSELGCGGFASVWLARDERSGDEVAIKILHPRYLEGEVGSHGPTVASRFVAEARILRQLEHPGLVRIHEVIEEPPRIVAYAMERLDGWDLSEWSNRVGLKSLLDIFAQVAETLAFLHGHGVIHRDVKPSNIFIVDTEITEPAYPTAKLLDFGIAKELHAQAALDNTADDTFLGTYTSMAPESLNRAAGNEITGAMDQWSLAVSLYKCLTGRFPFEDPTPVGLFRKIQTAAPSRPQLLARLGYQSPPDEIIEVLDRCLDKDPARRYGDAGELAQALRRARDAARPDQVQANDPILLTDNDTKDEATDIHGVAKLVVPWVEGPVTPRGSEPPPSANWTQETVPEGMEPPTEGTPVVISDRIDPSMAEERTVADGPPMRGFRDPASVPRVLGPAPTIPEVVASADPAPMPKLGPSPPPAQEPETGAGPSPESSASGPGDGEGRFEWTPSLASTPRLYSAPSPAEATAPQPQSEDHTEAVQPATSAPVVRPPESPPKPDNGQGTVPMPPMRNARMDDEAATGDPLGSAARRRRSHVLTIAWVVVGVLIGWLLRGA